jgi:hypothetical protein
VSLYHLATESQSGLSVGLPDDYLSVRSRIVVKKMKRLVAQVPVDVTEPSQRDTATLVIALIDAIERNSNLTLAGVNVISNEDFPHGPYGESLDTDEEEAEEMLLEIVHRLENSPAAIRDVLGADLLNRMRDFVGL